ncbi:hypothetical protein LTR97_001816 [Elasticomyces elasticus]|uniref:Phytanoyl-CoA dioxygenase n=1 Tax=Elasticomyces elasticus TaxID=574655 RepID=A0AAN8A673_9PEZI|nr:hypothetical protein LTR97_001816 [Elasticomyces elasticus]
MSSTTSAEELRASLERDGFVRIQKAFSTDDITRFRTAAQHVAERARAGRWPFVRTVPKQFPPWPVSEATTEGIWGVQHLLHPSMPDEDRIAFAESYFGDVMTGAVTALLDCKTSDLVMELYNMLVCPPKDFELRWHRDDIGPDVPPDVELERLQEPMLHTQWNLALYPDSSLVVVPGSHARARSGEERKADPFEGSMPGQGADPSRSRNILQHGIGDWAGDCDFSDLPGNMAKLATEMQQRLIGMGSGKDVGFSQRD